MKKKVKCWEIFKCNKEECPVYKSKELRCWLISGTHCRDDIQGKFLEKMEMCLDCEIFKANMDVATMRETINIVNKQFKEFRAIVNGRDRELENVGMELALGLSEVLEALNKIASGDPRVRISEVSENELIAKLKQTVNKTAEGISTIVDQSHEFAIGLAEHFDILHRVSKGELSARISESSQEELLKALGEVTNQMIGSVSREIAERKKAEESLRESEEKYRTVFETTGTSTVIIEEDTIISLTNAEFEKLSGYSKEEIEGKKSWTEFAVKDDLERMKEYHRLRRINPGAVPSKYEFRFIDRQGNVKDIFLTISMIPGTKKSVASLLDITERKKAEEALREKAEREDLILRSLPMAFYTAQTFGHFGRVWVSEQIDRISGFPANKFVEDPYFWISRLYPNHREKVLKEYKTIHYIDTISTEYLWQCADGSYRWFRDQAVLIRDEQGNPKEVIGTWRDITERKNAEETLRAMSLVDDLTGLRNRRGFFTLAEQQIKISNRMKRGMFLLFADLDGLKWINDNLGHNEGDLALVDAANILKETFRDSDIIARIGGDEFVVLIIEPSDGTEKITTRLQEKLEGYNTKRNRPYKLSLSTGISLYDPEYPCSIEELLSRADKAMYEQKQKKQKS